jgi:hypothetical protein
MKIHTTELFGFAFIPSLETMVSIPNLEHFTRKTGKIVLLQVSFNFFLFHIIIPTSLDFLITSWV